MRTFIFGLLGLFGILGSVRADVVLTNFGTANSSVGFPGGSISLVPSQTITSGTLLVLKVLNSGSGTGGSATASLASLSLNMTVGGSTSNFSGSLVGGGSIGIDSYGDFQFDLGSKSYTNGSNFAITINSVFAETTNANAKWGTGTTPISGVWSSSSPAPSSSGMFSLDVVAVPEPGTFLLGGLAAVSGGCGIWWKRRRKILKNGDSISPV